MASCIEGLALEILLKLLAEDRGRLVLPAVAAASIAQAFKDDLDLANCLLSGKRDEDSAAQNGILRLASHREISE